jgi:hypothetical protein
MVIGAVLALGIVYVLLPIVVGAFRRYRGTKILRCPELGDNAEIGLDTRHATVTAAFKEPELKVIQCSHWPERQPCDEDCLREPANQSALHTISCTTAVSTEQLSTGL